MGGHIESGVTRAFVPELRPNVRFSLNACLIMTRLKYSAGGQSSHVETPINVNVIHILFQPHCLFRRHVEWKDWRWDPASGTS